MKIKTVAILATASLALGGVFGVQQFISSQIASKVQTEMPRASGISATVPLVDVPSNLISDSIKSVNININSFALKDSGTKTSLYISASSISKTNPTLIGSLEVTATIPASTITKQSEFNNAQIVGNTLQVSAGAGGVGTALLIPRYSNGKLYFEFQSFSILGNQIPASSLPAELQNQIIDRSQQSLSPPKGLKVKTVSLSSKGLSIKMFGNNVQLGNLGSGL